MTFQLIKRIWRPFVLVALLESSSVTNEAESARSARAAEKTIWDKLSG